MAGSGVHASLHYGFVIKRPDKATCTEGPVKGISDSGDENAKLHVWRDQ